jgi:hypothetical protein
MMPNWKCQDAKFEKGCGRVFSAPMGAEVRCPEGGACRGRACVQLGAEGHWCFELLAVRFVRVNGGEWKEVKR